MVVVQGHLVSCQDLVNDVHPTVPQQNMSYGILSAKGLGKGQSKQSKAPFRDRHGHGKLKATYTSSTKLELDMGTCT